MLVSKRLGRSLASALMVMTSLLVDRLMQRSSFDNLCRITAVYILVRHKKSVHALGW